MPEIMLIIFLWNIFYEDRFIPMRITLTDQIKIQ